MFKVKPQDYQDLPRKIDILLNLPDDQKKEIFQEAQLEIEKNFSKINMVNQYLKLYESIKS